MFLEEEGRPQTDIGKKPCDDKGREGSDAATSQGHGGVQKPPEDRGGKEGFSPGIFRSTWALPVP